MIHSTLSDGPHKPLLSTLDIKKLRKQGFVEDYSQRLRGKLNIIYNILLTYARYTDPKRGWNGMEWNGIY